MNNVLKTLSVVLLVSSLSAQAAKLTLTADDGFALKADYYQTQQQSDRAVLMLHQCNYNRIMYNDIGEQLAKQGVHALSLDFRGFGESSNEQFDIEKVQALPQEQRRAAWQEMSANWPKDVQKAYDFLKNKMSDKGVVGVIGASCGGGQAITLAENNPIKSLSFFSSAQREENIERYKKALSEKPTLIIAAQEDGRTYTSAQSLFEHAKHKNSRFVAYKGNDHGYPLLDKDKNLSTQIATWFVSQL